MKIKFLNYGNTDFIYLWPSGVHPARTRYSYQGKYSCKSKFRSKILEVTSPTTLEVLTLINFNADLALVSPVFGKRCVSVVPGKIGELEKNFVKPKM